MSTPQVPVAELTKTKAAALKESTPVIQLAHKLEVVDEESYVQADVLRSTLKSAIKKWSDRLELIIRPARQALDGLYTLNREITGPMEQASVVITSRMREYKRIEAQRIQEEEAKRVIEEARLKREQEEAQRKLDVAKSKPVQRLMEKKIEVLEERIEGVKQEVSVPVRAHGSGTRIVKVWEVKSIRALAKAVVERSIPEEVLQVNTAVMNDFFKGDTTPNKDSIRTWPGIVVRDNVLIVSKRGSV